MASHNSSHGKSASLACYLPSIRNATASAKTKRRMCSRINCDVQAIKTIFQEDESRAKDLLQAAWAMVLYKYTGMEGVCFGYDEFDMAVSVRRPGPLAVKYGINPEAQLGEFLKGKQGEYETLRSEGNQEYVKSQLHYNTAVMLQIRNSSDNTFSPAALASQQVAMSLPEEYKARILAKYMNGAFSVFLEYRHPDVSAAFASIISETFSSALHSLLEESASTIQELSKITDSDMRQIKIWNAVRPETVEKCIHNVIQGQIQLHSQKEAVCAWDGSLTYFELNEQASLLARRLSKLGVHAEARVALCFDKSKWNIIAMLAVLKAGGAFVPLDPSHPIARLEALVKEVEANIIICSTTYSARLSAAAEHVLCVDAEHMEIMAAEIASSHGDSFIPTTSANAAYILFTSGSTGKPKATVIEHQAFCSGAQFHGPAMLIESDSRVLQFAAHTFDASLVEILTPLMRGGTVCVPSEESRLNGIVAAINDLHVNQAFLTPSFVRFIKPAEVPNLTRLVLAGEALTQANIDTWSSINLVNGYGPTESSVAAVVNNNITTETACQDIGFPVGVRCWVVDPEDHDVLLPIGCTGELLLEGPSLARCYLNNPERTAESFISNPSWSQNPTINLGQSRFYKTGDLVRYNSDAGSFDFVGRKDTQVKYHGQRIELGEIESNLIKHSSIKHGLVMLPKTGPAALKLVGIISFSEHIVKDLPPVPTSLKMVDLHDREKHVEYIRESMAKILPTYMIPSIWLCIEAFPVLASRKLDRKTVSQWLDTLPAETLDAFRPTVNSTGVSMDGEITDMEATLRSIWSDVLNIPLSKTSIHHSFLSLGGDSITAMTCMNRCKQKGIGLTVQDILRSRSIRDLAKCVKLVAVKNDYQEDIDVPFELSPIQKLHFEVRDDNSGHFNQSFFLRVNQTVAPQDLENAIKVIIDRHSMLRARFFYDESEKQWCQRLTDQNQVSHRYNVHTSSSRVEVKNAIANSQASLNAMYGPVVAIDLFQMENQEQLLSLIGHHLVVDLVSWRVILEDLEELLVHSQSGSLLHPTLPFQSWSRLQWDQAFDLGQEATFEFQDVPLCDLSYWGIADTENTYGQVACESFEIDAETTSILLNEANSPVRTEPVDILVAALLYSFSKRFTDHALPVIHNEGHGREPWDNETDVSRTVGWFTIIYPIFVQTTALRDWVDTLVQVKDCRRRVKDNGREYFARSILGGENIKAFKPMEITFNYLGRYQQLEKAGALFSPVEGLAGETSQGGGAADFSKTTPRFGLFEISAVIVQDILRFTFSFNGNMRYQERIRQWVTDCQTTLSQMAKDLVSLQSQPTLSDFPLLSMDYVDLQALLTEKLPALGLKSLDEVEDIYPCSPMQRGLLISTSRDISFYAARGTYEVKAGNGNLVNAEMVAQGWQQVVDRHAMLRTVFIENLSSEDLYSQVVLRNYTCMTKKLRCADENDVLTVLDKNQMQADRQKPLHQFTICVTEAGKVFCRLEISHVIMDGTSISIMLHDLEKAYSASLSDVPKPLFSNFVSYLQVQPKGAAMNYWKSYLSGVEPCHMPILNDGISSSRQYTTLRLDFQKLVQLQSTCEKYGLTVANALNAAWALTLQCYTGSDDVCFGYLLSQRDIPVEMVEETVGPMINMLACRVSMSPESMLIRLVEGIQTDYMESAPYKHISLADVQHGLNLSGTALFNTCLSYRKLPSAEPAKTSVIKIFECGGLHDPTEYLVTINVEASETDAVIDLDFWTDMLSQKQARNIADTFKRALENMIEHPEVPLSQLDHIPTSNWQQIADWNNAMPETIEKCIHEVFEEQARLNPNNPAICAWDGEFTYSQVDSLSTRLSCYLANFGVIPESFVALCFDKSAYTIIAMIAVLKAGGACVPLDAGHPKAALELRVLETGAQVVLSSPSRTHLLDDVVPYAIPVDGTFFSQLEEADTFDITPAAPENAAFVIFTSGSTGKPKGVVLEHRSLVTSAAAHGAALGVDQSTRFLQFASYSFDNSLEEIFTTLMRGGCVCVPSEDDRMNNLAKAMNDLAVNFTDMTATVAAFLNPSDVPKLKGLAIGGEAPTKEIKETWCPVLRLQNIYGPTECSINCCHNPDVGVSSDVTNIGRAVGGVSWVVDANYHNKLVPIGCVGELLIEGPILARHYLNNPEKTQQSFIEDPFFMAKLAEAIGSPGPFLGSGHRMYKTGDLVRYNSDGSLVYLGRKDTQVKLNGQRIELGEIEHRIQSALPSEGQCSVDLVIRRNGEITSKALIAFICLGNDGKKPTQSDVDFVLPMTQTFQSMVLAVKSMISAQIQSYMVPNVYIPVSFFPMTSSGKLNRRLLRTTAEELLSKDASMYRLGGRSGREPSTEAEKALQNIWSSLLSVDAANISADDTFFRHGGDSISAMRLVTAARKQGFSISVADIFQAPRLSEIARKLIPVSKSDVLDVDVKIALFSLLDRNIPSLDIKREVSTICNVPLEQIEDIMPCSSIQEGLITLSNTQPGSYVTQNIYELPLTVDIERFKAAWQKLYQSESILRTRIIHSKSNGFLQVVVREELEWTSSPPPSFSIPGTSGGRLSRYTITKSLPGKFQFIWTAHHAIYDGWSIPKLFKKLQKYYENSSLTVENSSCSYSHFIKYVSGIDTEDLREFWARHLDSFSAVQFPELPNASYKSNPKTRQNLSIKMPAQRPTDVTLPSLIRAAWALTVSMFSFSDDIVFGEIMTGRDIPVPGIDDMIGPAFSIVPMRLQIDSDLTVPQYLQQIQAQAAAIIPYQTAGLQNIQGYSQHAKSACEFRTLFSIAHGESDDVEGVMKFLSANSGDTNFFTYPLNVSCFMWDSNIEIQIQHDDQIIPMSQLDRIIAQFEATIQKLCFTAQEVKLSGLEIITSSDILKIHDWNSQLALTLVDRCIHDVIDDNVRSRPGALAIDSWDGTFTYEQLGRYVGSLAAHLQKLLGNEKDQFIPICFEKSAFAAISMLAIMKAGYAFVPIDPQHPKARRQEIISDIDAKIILCSPRYANSCQEVVTRAVAIDMDLLVSLPEPKIPFPRYEANTAAYVIFTSGSTGKPKGCIIEHSGFCSGAVKNGPAFSFSPSSRVLQFASYTFDASLLEILTVLVMGGCTCVPYESTRLNGIAKFINEKKVNTALLTPSMAQTIKPVEVPCLKNLALVGEAMTPAHLAIWANEVRLINGYGPTETSIVAAANARMTLDTDSSNIGTPVGNAWIVDPRNHDRLMPVGAIGELLVEGPTLARGYLNNIAKTEEVFITNPAWSIAEPGPRVRRMYKTGDLVRYAPDESGELLYVGRKDSQAKLHGQRLELGEVEHHLNGDSEVLNAIALLPKTGRCSKKLVAVISLRYILAASENNSLEIVTDQLAFQRLHLVQERLREKVPAYMTPSTWVILRQLPLLPSGKLDRKTITHLIENIDDTTFNRITSAGHSKKADKVVVITQTEAALREIWGSVLKLSSESIDLDRSFLHLGGDSMSAMAVMSRCRSQNLGVTVENIITCKSIRHLASLVTKPQISGHTEEDYKEFDLSPIQSLYFRCMQGQPTHFNQSIMIEISDSLSKDQIQDAISKLISTHPMLRARFSRDGNGIWKQRILQHGQSCYGFRVVEYLDLEELAEEVEETQKSLDVMHGPVVAGTLFQDSMAPGLKLLLCAHHLVVDVISWGIIVQDLEDLLQGRQLTSDQDFSFQKWCRLQLDYVKEQKDNSLLPVEDIPAADLEFWGMKDVSNTHGGVVVEEIDLDSTITDKLLEAISGPLNCEIVDVLLAALLLSFRRVFSSRKSLPCIWNEGHGREPWDTSIDLSRTVGWFTTMSPVHLPTEFGTTDENNINKCISWVKALRRRTPGKGMPYFAQRLLTWEGSEKYRGHWPMEMTFNYLGQHKESSDSKSRLQLTNGTGQSVNSESDIGPEVPRFSLIEISAAIVNGCMNISISVNKSMKKQGNIQQWIEDLKSTICQVSNIHSQTRASPSLADFRLLPLTYNGIDQITRNLQNAGISSFENIEDIYPCSSMQHGIILSQLKDSSTYAYRAIFEVETPSKQGKLDPQKLVVAWQSVVDRHTSLRTTFIDGNHEASLMDQVVLKSCPARVDVFEVAEGDAKNMLASLPDLDFKNGNQLHRLSICTDKGGKVFCRFDISNAIADGTSMPIIFRDLSRAYMELPPVTERQPQYSDFVAHLMSQPKEKSVTYWTKYLEGSEPCIFPSLINDQKKEKSLGSEIITMGNNAAVHEVCKSIGITMSALFQFVWAMVLRTYTGSDEVCFGYISSGRDVPVQDVEEAVGAFINMLIYKINLTDDLPLVKALKKTQKDFIKSMEHQAVSLAEVQHALGLADTSLFNTAFTFQRRGGLDNDSEPSLSFHSFDSHDPSEYKIAVNIEMMESVTEVHFSYWQDFLSSAQVKHITDTFEKIITEITSSTAPGMTIGKMKSLGSLSYQNLRRWNNLPPPMVNRCVHEMIEEQVRIRPAMSQAVEAWDAKLTYRDLDSYANRLANVLIDHGVGPEVIVPLCFEKSAWAIVAQIAVLKAGGAFVSLDASHPEDRLKSLIEDVNGRVVLSSAQQFDKISKIFPSTIAVDKKSLSQLTEASQSSRTSAKPNNTAYVIFTSGSTGKPKGTIIEHGQFCTAALAHADALHMNSETRSYQFANYTFDASILDVLTILILGGCICVPNAEERMNDVARSITRLRANWMCITPSVASTLKPESIPTMKVIAMGGEKMNPGAIEKWSKSVCLVEAYGPSECSVVCAASDKVNQTGQIVNFDPAVIGKAVGSRSWVVDQRNYNRLVPVGAIGELVIEGHIVGRGYLNNEKKTKEAFIKDPAWASDDRFKALISPGTRMYRTGDLVRYNEDGTLTYMARMDMQIKLNGQRIELGEIEYQCTQHMPENCQLAVDLVAPGAHSGPKKLAMFFSLVNSENKNRKSPHITGKILLDMNSEARNTVQCLEKTVAQVLPSYMIPQLFFPVSKIPFTTSGKLDRRKLLGEIGNLSREELKQYSLSTTVKRIAPTDERQITLQGLWEEVLAIPKASIGSDDSFFRLGGDSLAAMRLVGIARSRGIALSVVDIFRHPTLEEMSKNYRLTKAPNGALIKPFSLLRNHAVKETIINEIAAQCDIQPELIADIYPCSALQEGLVTSSVQQKGAYIARNILKLGPHVDIVRFKDAWQKLVDEFDILRTRILHTASSDFLQVVLKEQQISWNYHSDLESALDDSSTIFNPQEGVLSRYILIQQKNTSVSHFVWLIHHALYDAWSLDLLLKRVQEIYFDKIQSTSTVAYAPFISYLEKQTLQDVGNFWKTYLSNSSPAPFPPNVTQIEKTRDTTSNTLTQKLNIPQQFLSLGITMPILIRAAWALVLSSRTQSSDVCFGETLSGRNIDVPHIAEIAGPVLTTVPTHIHVDTKLKIKDYLLGIQKTSTEMIPHQHFGLQNIKKLGHEQAAACQFRNLIVVQTADAGGTNELWEVQDNGDVGSFFTYPLVIECKTFESNIEVNFHYDEKVISRWELERIGFQLSHILHQLGSVNSSSTDSLEQVDTLSPEDKQEIKWLNKRQPHVIDACIHDLFKKRFTEQPDAPAVHAWDASLTYADLNKYASSLATHLQSLGVKPEVLVPLCLEKSAWTIVAMYAVLMAGGAIVPLDPSHPIDRHREIVEQTGATVLLYSSKYNAKYAGIIKHAISIDEDIFRTTFSKAIDDIQSSGVTSSNAAYAIFTSGSTGKPKGIIIEHKAFNTSSVAFDRALQMTSKIRALQFASLSFDAAVMEIFTTLTVGGCVCVPSEEERLQDLAGTIRRMNVTWTLLTSSVANLIDPTSVPSLKVLVCGGEAMSPEVIAKWHDKVHLINAYGPTEASVVAVVNPDVSIDAPNNIGYGIQPTTTWILNPEDHNQLTPMGSVGELALGGPTLSRGYLGDTAKTTAAFIVDPAWAKDVATEAATGLRIHLTGDLVKYRHDGSVHFIGRKDNQVKLNGQRMELGEIEHRLEVESFVRHVIVSVPKSGPLQKRLVAVLSLNNAAAIQSVVTAETFQLVEKSAEISRIKSSLESQLPSYMLPQAWIAVNAMPMLVSGKLNRKLVKNWIEGISDQLYQQIVGADEPDDTPLEMTGAVATLREIWAQVLNQPVDKINPNRSFLSLGGDSITAMAVVSRSRRQNIKVTLHDILRSSSLIKLAGTVESATMALPVPVEVMNQGFDLSPIQQMYFLAAKEHQGSSRFNQSYNLRLSRYVSPESVESALQTIVSNQSMLRARFRRNAAGAWQQQVSSDIKSSFRYRNHQISSLDEAAKIVEDSQGHVDIYEGPIIVADLMETTDQEQFLCLAAHHLVVDIVSWQIIIQDLTEILESGSLPNEKPLSFQSWCKIQSEHFKHGTEDYKLPFKVLPANLGYWGMENVSNNYGDVERRTFTLDEAMTASTMTSCHKVFGTEPLDIFMTAIIHSFKLVFKDRFLPTVFNEGHGREAWDSAIDLSRTVGWFTNISPLQIALETGMFSGEIAVMGRTDEKDDVLDTLKNVKDARRSSREAGRAYLAQRFLGPKDRLLSSHSDMPMEILFNYLGSMQTLERDDSLFKDADMGLEKADPLKVGDMGRDTIRLALFEVSAAVVQHRAEFAFMFSRKMKRLEEINRWISECKWILEEIVVRLRRCTPEPTLSDYPLLPVNYDGLKRLIKTSFPQAGISNYQEVEEVYPCSPTQEGMLLSQLRDPKAYLFHIVFEVTGTDSRHNIDPVRLTAAWQEVVNRHAALRTVFVNSTYKGGSFDQAVLKNVENDVIQMECNDAAVLSQLQSVSLHDRNGRRKQKIPHQLTICITPSRRVFMKIEVNHAVIDGGSTPILIQDLQRAYDGLLPDGRGPLYSDYIRYIKSQSPRDDIVYWKRYLSGIQACYFPRLKSTFNSQRRLASLQFNFDGWQDIQHYCERAGVTLANVIQAAWALVLRKYTGADDVCFGYLSAGRDAPIMGIQETIGVFINMLCCRVRFSPSQLLAEIPSVIQDDYVRAIPHQRCSLAQVQHELGLQGKQIFNTALSIQNHSTSESSDEGSLVFSTQEAHDPSEYAITLNIETGRNQEGIVFRYWTDMFSSEHASDISKTLANVLNTFAREPTETVSRLGKQESDKPLEIVETKHLENGQKSLQSEDELHDIIEKYPGLQTLIDDRVRMIVQQMFNLNRPGSIRRALSNATEHDILVLPQSESDAISSISDDLYREEAGDSAIPVAAQIHERGIQANIEEKLLRLWSEKIGLPLDSITKDDSFFDLGGDSITAMALVGDARDDGLILTVADVFRNPVFKDMASVAQTASEKSYVEDEINNMNILGGQPSSFISAKPGFYERFALIKAANIDEAFLQKYICPRVGVFKGGIVDILPVTDFQALSITGALLDSRWMLNFFCLDGRGPLDFRRLKQSCFRVVHAFDILRTVFVASKGRFLQVILRKVRPEFSVYETDESLDEFTANLQQRDITEGVKQGEPFVQFVIVREKNTDKHRIILRLSHAQYDGVSLPRILSAIKAGYEGGPIPSPVSFANFVRESARIVTADHYQHWRTLLDGSSMTQIVNRHESIGYKRHRASKEALRKTIRAPPMAHGNITTATVIKAAWALTLARMAGSADVIFGHTISGRNTAAITGVESMVGPCMNIVPVRVVFSEKWTVLDLLRYIQDQQVANMPYEALGFRQIIHKCTNWPRSTHFSTVLQHDTGDASNEMHLGDNIYTVKAVGSDEEMTDFSINSKSLDRDRVEIVLTFSVDEQVTISLAQRVMDMVCDTAETFTVNPDMTLPSPSSLATLPIRDHDNIDKSLLGLESTKQQVEDNSITSSQLSGLSRAEILVLSDVLRRAWEQVLTDTTNSPNEDVPPPIKPDSSFFNLGGDLIGLAQVAWLLEQEDFKVRLDDLIEHPTMMGQMAALVQSNSVTAQRIMASYHAGVAASSATAASATDGSVTGEEPPRSGGNNKGGQLRKSKTWASAFGLARKIVKRKVEVEG